MKFDYIIKNGRVIDPSHNLDTVQDIYIRNSRVVSLPSGDIAECEHIIDAEGCMKRSTSP
ncbi:MAG: hypothetical protein IJQ24_03305 [Synergistaceae bacterium]|nr:hypothetical protein [Synergistaceae bacterium]MBR0185037.1 hypothetical protein [Synergistaceae bacterium]